MLILLQPRLKLQATDGKMRLTDVANTEELLRIIQSVPSPKAEPFKLWLAQTGADHLLDLADAKKLQEEIDTRIRARDDGPRCRRFDKSRICKIPE